MLSAGFLLGCSPAPHPLQNDAIDEEVDAVTGADVWLMDTQTHRDSFSDIGLQETSSYDVETDISFSDIIEWLDTLTDVIKPLPPTPPKMNLFSELPCGFPASIRIDESSERIFVTCGAAQGSLQERSLSGGVSSPWESFEEFDGYPSNHVILSGGYHLVTRSSPDGFVLIDDVSRKISDEIIFSEEEITDENGEPLAFLPNMPSGAALIDDNICIATSNMDHIDMDPSKSTYNEGTLICFPYDGLGAVAHDASTAYYTKGINPTAVAPIETNKLAVLCSNGSNPAQSTHLSIDIFSFPSGGKISHSIEPDEGGSFTGIISPDMPVSQDGTILVGLQRPSNVDAANGEKLFEMELGGVDNFISSLQIFGNVAAASDFGPFGGSGKVIFFNTDESGWAGTIETELSANPGPATIFDGMLYQTTTDASMSGAIYTTDLSGMN